MPYRYRSEARTYIPDFIVDVDDGNGGDDLLHMVVEIKGYRGKDAKEKKKTIETYWVPGVNRHATFGRWRFTELTDLHSMQEDFDASVKAAYEDSTDWKRPETGGEAVEWLAGREEALQVSTTSRDVKVGCRNDSGGHDRVDRSLASQGTLSCEESPCWSRIDASDDCWGSCVRQFAEKVGDAAQG